MARRLASLAIGLAILAGAVTPVAAQSDLEVQKEIIQLAKDSGNPETAAKAAKRLRQIIAKGLDPKYERAARQLLLRALVTGEAPSSDIVAAAADAAPAHDAQPRQRVVFNAELSEILLSRGDAMDEALEFAMEALAAVPNEAHYAQLRGAVRGIVGRVQVERGEYTRALAELNAALPASPDSQKILYYIGAAYQNTKRYDQAIDAYIRSMAVFPGGDTSAEEPLRALYVQRKGRVEDLERKIEKARYASMKRVAIDSRREDLKAPHWRLPDFEGNHVQLADYRGKILVVDFWGSWCGPCRAELPYFQAMHERYKGTNVAFLGINWERYPSADQRLKAAKGFMEENNLDFPVVIDHTAEAVKSYSVDAFPTILLIDQHGHVRFRNPGFNPAIEDIVIAQIEYLRNK